MEISRVPSGLPPSAREEISQRLQNGRGAGFGGDPTSAERHAAAERSAADRDAVKVQMTAAVDRTAQPNLTEPTRDAVSLRSPAERGARLDLRI